MTENLWTVAFDGPGEISEENAAALLDKELPQDIEAIYLPERISRKQRGLRVVASWLLEVFGESGVQKTDNILDALSKGDTPVLVWLRGETDSEDDIAVLTAALNEGVHVLDASQGLDDIDFDPEDVSDQPVDPPEEPEPVAEAPARKTRATSTPKAAKPAAATTAPRRATTRTSRAADGGRAVTGTRPAAVSEVLAHPASQSTGPNGEDELAGKRRGKPRSPIAVDKVIELMAPVVKDMLGAGSLATDTPTSVEEDEAAENLRVMPTTVEELDRYIDDRIGHGFHLASLAMQPKQQIGRPKLDGSEPTAYLDKELTFVVKNGVASLRTRGKPVPGQETFTMMRRDAIAEGLLEG